MSYVTQIDISSSQHDWYPLSGQNAAITTKRVAIWCIWQVHLSPGWHHQPLRVCICALKADGTCHSSGVHQVVCAGDRPEFHGNLALPGHTCPACCGVAWQCPCSLLPRHQSDPLGGCRARSPAPALLDGGTSRGRRADTASHATTLELNPSWDRTDDPEHAHRHLRVAGHRTVELAQIQLFVVRGDDIRTEQTPNIEILRWAAAHAKLLESVEATLSTTDKYAPLERAPQLPHPITFPASTTAEAAAAIGRLPRDQPYFVLKDRYGYGGAQVHRPAFDAIGLEAEVADHIAAYGDVLIQEFRAEVGHGDLVITFFDDELLGALRRIAPPGEWRTNASIGALEVGVTLTAEQEGDRPGPQAQLS